MAAADRDIYECLDDILERLDKLENPPKKNPKKKSN